MYAHAWCGIFQGIFLLSYLPKLNTRISYTTPTTNFHVSTQTENVSEKGRGKDEVDETTEESGGNQADDFSLSLSIFHFGACFDTPRAVHQLLRIHQENTTTAHDFGVPHFVQPSPLLASCHTPPAITQFRRNAGLGLGGDTISERQCARRIFKGKGTIPRAHMELLPMI
jgi:hypothetical protein